MRHSSSPLSAGIAWRLVAGAIVAAVVLSCPGAPAAATAAPSHPLILKNANSNENTLVRGELVSTLTGNVIFLYDDLTIYSDFARWWRNEGTVRLNGNVRVVRVDGDTLTCDEMVFLKGRRQLDATGRVDYRSPSDRLHVYGRQGRYDMAADRFTLTGDPHFLRFDSAAAETLTIVGMEMVYEDSLGIASARRNVRITKGRLVADCDRAAYDTKKQFARLRGKPHITHGLDAMDGDSVDLVFRGDTLRGVSVDGSAHGLYREEEGADTNVTNVWSDSMYLAMTERGAADSVWAWENVFSTYYLSAESDSANQVSGKAMVLAFESKAELRSALVWGNARSVYRVREEDGSGCNNASGDSIRVFFADGKATDLCISGSVRGAYYPENGRQGRRSGR